MSAKYIFEMEHFADGARNNIDHLSLSIAIAIDSI